MTFLRIHHNHELQINIKLFIVEIKMFIMRFLTLRSICLSFFINLNAILQPKSWANKRHTTNTTHDVFSNSLFVKKSHFYTKYDIAWNLNHYSPNKERTLITSFICIWSINSIFIFLIFFLLVSSNEFSDIEGRPRRR